MAAQLSLAACSAACAANTTGCACFGAAPHNMDYPLEQDGPNHLGCDAIRLREHQMALITSDCAPFRPHRRRA